MTSNTTDTDTDTDIFALADDVATKWRELSDALARLGTHASAYVEQIAPVMAEVVTAVATNVTEAAEVARILSADATGSTQDAEHAESGESSTPSDVEAATAWLLADHDERVTTGIVRPASERAAELVAAIRAADEAQPIPAVDIPAWREMGDSCGG